MAAVRLQAEHATGSPDSGTRAAHRNDKPKKQILQQVRMPNPLFGESWDKDKNEINWAAVSTE